MKIKDITEAFAVGDMPEIGNDSYQTEYAKLLAKSSKVADVRSNLSLYQYLNKYFMLVKDGSIILGNVTLSPVTIAGKQYQHVDGIYIRPDFRKTSALYWLMYSIKEVVSQPVIADGAIFTDGQALIAAIQKHKSFNVFKLGKYSGSKTPLDGPINHEDFCYVFESAKIGFGKHFFEGTTLPYVWYPLFEEIK